MLWCHLQSVFCVLTAAAVSPRKRPLKVSECEPGPSWKVGRAGQPCTTKQFKFTTPFPLSRGFEFNPLRPSLLRRFVTLYRRRFGTQRTIDSTRLMDGTKVEVIDSLEDDERGIFMRNLFINGIRTSIMNLQLPSELVPSQQNSTKWDPDHDSLVFIGYTISMIEEMFAYGKAEMNENATAKVLSIGLGGGYINSYLHRNYRRMNITVVEIDEVMLNISRRWFGLIEDSRQRVIIRNGAEYVRAAADARESFDVIFLDACTMDRDAQVNCPSNSFLNPDVVQSFHKLLGARGILVINVMTLKDEYTVAVRLNVIEQIRNVDVESRGIKEKLAQQVNWKNMFAYYIADMRNDNATAKVLSIGLGGGYINSYLHRNYRRMNITVVEIDEVMLNISRKWFGLNADSRQRVIIRDDVQYVREAASARETFDVIFLDACTMDQNATVNFRVIASWIQMLCKVFMRCWAVQYAS